MVLTSEQLGRLAKFVDALENLGTAFNVEVGAYSGTGLVIDGECVMAVELRNVTREVKEGEGVIRQVRYSLETT